MDYPFDAGDILKSKRALKKQLAARENLLPKKIALLSGATIGEIQPILELFLLDAGIRPSFYVGDYGRYFEDLVFDSGALRDFAPDIVYIHTSVRNLEALPAPGGDAREAEEIFQNAAEKHRVMLKAAQRLDCPVIINNYEYPRLRVMGSYDAVAPSGAVRFVRRLNEWLAEYADTHTGVYLHDLCYLAAWRGLDSFTDPAYYNAYKYAVNPADIPWLCHSVAAIIRSIFGKNKKALMLDLDNTLWGGVVGDDGVEGLALGPDSPGGMGYQELQRYAKALSGIGVMLGVCSKNEDQSARSGFTHPASLLSPDDFLTFKANWSPKDQSLRESAGALNIGTDALVFADDNPAERERVRASGLGVAVPELGEPERYAETIANAGYFEVTSLSADDRGRMDSMKQNARRAAESAAFSDYGEYLRSLRMTAVVAPFSPPVLERLTQLANKTNQFNLTTRRYQIQEMARRMENPDTVTLYGRLADKFGDNGIVTEIIGNIAGNTLDIELWIMSCRVFQRGLEYLMFDELVGAARARGVKTITGTYLPTEKNKPVEKLYETLGFTRVAQDGAGSVWRYEIPADYQKKNQTIEVRHE